MKKLSNKKGLFLAEILLAVVIAAVIMGSGYLLYADIQSENNKNTATSNLQALIAKMTVIFGEQNIAGTIVDETSTLVKTKDIPSTMATNSTTNTLESVYGKAMKIGPVGADTKNWYVTYTNLTQEQCAKFLPGINKTKPIAITAAAANKATTTAFCGANVNSKRKGISAGLCKVDGPLTVYFSPAKQNYSVCVAQ
jgi:Tfp pilus assembly protein PilE